MSTGSVPVAQADRSPHWMRRIHARACLGAAMMAFSPGFVGCAHGALSMTVAETEAAAPIPSAVGQANELPEGLLGVWYRNDMAGRAQCARYRAIPVTAGESDEGSTAMIGSIVMTPRLIHEYAEYGEGNFNSIRGVERVDHGTWRVNVEIGIDSIPSGSGDAGFDTYRLELDRDRLEWSRWDSPDDPPQPYFRCGAVRSDLYQIS